MLNLDIYEQQIILAAKGHSKMKEIYGQDTTPYEVIKSIIARMTKISMNQIDNHKMYYWLLNLIKKLDNEFNFNWREQLLDSMFCTDWIFSRTSRQDTINIIDINKKLISMLAWMPIIKDNKDLIILIEDDQILNEKYI